MLSSSLLQLLAASLLLLKRCPKSFVGFGGCAGAADIFAVALYLCKSKQEVARRHNSLLTTLSSKMSACMEDCSGWL